MPILPSNLRQDAHHGYNDLNEEEAILLHDCMTNIRKHVDKNIDRTKNASELARLLTFRRHLLTAMANI